MKRRKKDVPPAKVWGYIHGHDGKLERNYRDVIGQTMRVPCVLMTVARYQAVRKKLSELIAAVEDLDFSYGRAQQVAVRCRLNQAIEDLKR